MAKRIFFTLIGLIVLVGALAGAKALQIRRLIDNGSKFVPPPETVTSAQVRSEFWDATLSAAGSLSAVQGVSVAAEVSGKVVQIAFEAGAVVNTGDLLVRQDTSSEQAELRAHETTVALNRLNYTRLKELLQKNTISRSEFDTAEATLQQSLAQADRLRAVIAKKSIRAPFAGRLGIRQVNLGQILKEGDPIVSLQSIAPIYVNFLLPQQHLAQIKLGLAVHVKTDALSGGTIEGKITAIDPQIDASTRNIRIQATVTNSEKNLLPGMFADVTVRLPGEQQILVIPATSILYAPYGDSVFVIENNKDGKSEQASEAARAQVARQQFVRLGPRRGDFVAALSGLRKGQTIVSTGVFKLRNGQTVKVNNALAPKFELAPRPDET